MSLDKEKEFFNQLKAELSQEQLSDNHLEMFDKKLGVSKTFPLFFYSKIAVVIALGLFLTHSAVEFYSVDPAYLEYQETKSYFSSYVKYEIGIKTEQLNPKTEGLINSSLIEIEKLTEQNHKLEKQFINQSYDKRVLKQIIDNFRLQLDILENVDDILELSTPKLQEHENIL